MIILLPFLFYSYRVIPEIILFFNNTFFKITIETENDFDYYIWIIAVKILTLGILTIWYITCPHRWKYALIIPIVVELYKIILNLFEYKTDKHFNFETILLTIFCAFIYLYFLKFLSNILGFDGYQRSVRYIVNSEINSEIENISNFKINEYKGAKKEFFELQKNKIKLEDKVYLRKLIDLRNRMY
ncbi:hypothetical protein AB9K26_09150 [Psychroserpens sp. XS_ASV72]|uniref:hypothetical protein n=1 Tax=Psychroserpens sp. XS_ASV72 TaxID=3241293 RepID=UPI0035177DC6